MTNMTPADRHRRLRLLGALAGLSVVLGACNLHRRRSGDGERSRRLPPASPHRDPGSQPLDRDLRRSCPRRPVGSAARRRPRAGADLGSRRHRRDRRRRAGRHAERTGRGECFREIRSLLAAGGVPPRGITLHQYRPDDPRTLATIRLSYPRIAAVAGPCGTWPEDLGPSLLNRGYSENKPYYNFGCAYQRNLAAMIDNPADLEQPRSETAAYTIAAHGGVREISQGRTDRDHLSRRRKGQTQRYRQMIRRPPNPRRAAGHTAARERLHRAGTARVGAGLLRDDGDRRRGPGGRRRPSPRQGPSHRQDGRHRRPPSKPITPSLRRT